MRLYKLTDAKGQTHGKTQWGEGVTHSGTGEGELCGPGFIHAYTDPLLAVLFNPIHANFREPRLWEAEGEVVKNDLGLKVGCVSLTTIREIPMPKVTTEHRVRFAIFCALEACGDKDFAAWAQSWLDGTDRTEAAAGAAAGAAREAAWAAWAAEAAARAAAWEAVRAAAWAAGASAREAAWAAEAAAWSADIDLIAIAHKACGERL